MRGKHLTKVIALALMLSVAPQITSITFEHSAKEFNFIESAYALDGITYSVNSQKGQAYNYETRWGNPTIVGALVDDNYVVLVSYETGLGAKAYFSAFNRASGAFLGSDSINLTTKKNATTNVSSITGITALYDESQARYKITFNCYDSSMGTLANDVYLDPSVCNATISQWGGTYSVSKDFNEFISADYTVSGSTSATKSYKVDNWVYTVVAKGGSEQGLGNGTTSSGRENYIIRADATEKTYKGLAKTITVSVNGNTKGSFTKTTGEQVTESNLSRYIPSDDAYLGKKFSNWSVSLPYTVTSDKTIEAEFDSCNVYTVTFKDSDGTELGSTQVNEGTSALSKVPISGSNITWSNETGVSINNITKDCTFTAVYDSSDNKLTVQLSTDATTLANRSSAVISLTGNSLTIDSSSAKLLSASDLLADTTNSSGYREPMPVGSDYYWMIKDKSDGTTKYYLMRDNERVSDEVIPYAQSWTASSSPYQYSAGLSPSSSADVYSLHYYPSTDKMSIVSHGSAYNSYNSDSSTFPCLNAEEESFVNFLTSSTTSKLNFVVGDTIVKSMDIPKLDYNFSSQTSNLNFSYKISDGKYILAHMMDIYLVNNSSITQKGSVSDISAVSYYPVVTDNGLEIYYISTRDSKIHRGLFDSNGNISNIGTYEFDTSLLTDSINYYSVKGFKDGKVFIAGAGGSSSRKDTNLYSVDLSTGKTKCIIQSPTVFDQIYNCTDDASKVYIQRYSGAVLPKGIFNAK